MGRSTLVTSLRAEDMNTVKSFSWRVRNDKKAIQRVYKLNKKFSQSRSQTAQSTFEVQEKSRLVSIANRVQRLLNNFQKTAFTPVAEEPIEEKSLAEGVNARVLSSMKRLCHNCDQNHYDPDCSTRQKTLLAELKEEDDQTNTLRLGEEDLEIIEALTLLRTHKSRTASENSSFKMK